MPFGLTLQGFNPARLEDVRQALIDAFKAAFGQNIRVDDRSFNGQLIGIFAEVFADLWEAGEDTYTAGFIGSSVGPSLDDLVALAGVPRLGATFSVVVMTLTGTPATPVPSGTIFRDPITALRWVTSADATIGGGGTIIVNASPESTGPTIGLAGTITEIVTPVSGLTSVTNLLDATVGRAAETDAALRSRFILSFRVGGGSSVEAVRAVLLNLDNVTEAFVFENTNDVVDADGRPPHSIEAVVRGGDQQEIIDALWLAKSGGIESFGTNVAGSAVDSQGDAQAIGFTRPTSVSIHVEVEYEALDDPPEDLEDLAEVEILEFGSAFTTGQDVLPFRFVQNIETVGFKSMTFKVGLAASPPFDDPLTISPRQIADFDSSRIVFARTN